MQGFTVYNKEVLFNTINRISISQVGSQVITKFGDRVMRIANVSNRYEIFDIQKYLKDKIEDIETNFKIAEYSLKLTRGQQQLTLISEPIDIDGISFYKSFFILNSSDKSRRLSFNLGLYCDTSKFYVISGVRNAGLNQKHLKGVTEAAELATSDLSGETFDQQITMIQSLLGHRIKLSKIQEAIMSGGDLITNHRKFDAFKNSVRWAHHNHKVVLAPEMVRTLNCESKDLKFDQSNDFYLDAYWSFQIYLTLFNRQDAHIIRNETERIMGITQWAVRNAVLESLGV